MRKLQVLAVVLMVALGALLGCAPKATPTPAPATPKAAIPTPTSAPAAATPAPAPRVATPAPQAAPARPAWQAEWDNVVQMAKKEGQVVVYMGLGADAQTAIMEGFKKSTGLRAEILGIDGAKMREKVRMEQQIGVPIADVVIPGSMAAVSFMVTEGLAQGITATLPEAENKAAFRVHPLSWDPQKKMGFIIQNISNPTLFINTNLVKPEEEPQSWFDLLDPKWKGKMIIRDPSTSGPTNNSYPAWKTLGDDYWRKLLIPQEVWREDKAGRLIDAVVLGEKAICIFPSTSRAEMAIQAGAPVKFIHLKEGSAINTKGGTIVKNAPHINAALILVNWLISKEGQMALGKSDGRVTLRNDVNHDWIKIDAFKPGAEKKNFEQEVNTVEQQNEVMAFFTKLVSKK